MKLAEVKEKAMQQGLTFSKVKKDDLVRAIQAHEGNNPCFKTNVQYCSQMDCCWRSDCMPNN